MNGMNGATPPSPDHRSAKEIALAGKSAEARSKILEYQLKSGIQDNDALFWLFASMGVIEILALQIPEKIDQAIAALIRILSGFAADIKVMHNNQIQIAQNVEKVLPEQQKVAAQQNQVVQNGEKLLAQQQKVAVQQNQIVQDVEKLLTQQRELAAQQKKNTVRQEQGIVYLEQDTQQQWLMAGGVVAAIALFSGAWFWGWHRGQAVIAQRFGGEDKLEYWEDLNRWNRDRLLKCQSDQNPKCTFYIVDESQRPPE
jgi:hypothetical protein